MMRVALLFLACVVLTGCGSQQPTPTPVALATAMLTPSPTAEPTSTATPTATYTPTASATATPTATPTCTPTPTDTATPSPLPTDTPTSTPTETATPTMTPEPTFTSTRAPTPTPTAEPGQTLEHPGLIAYTQITETGAEIFALDLSTDPRTVFQLTETSGAAYCPRWSPDLRFIAHIYYDPETDAEDFWLIDILSDSAHPISAGGMEGLDQRFAWSPDSRFLVYAAAQPDGFERDIYRLEVESGEIVNLTADSPVWDSSPAWSPNGEWIAFVSDRAEGGKGLDDLWVMKPDGTELRNATNSSDWEDIKPAWSPDSREIAFYRWAMYGSEERGPSGLWVTTPDGSEERLVIQLNVMFPTFDAPVWSPDGRFIAYQFGLPGEKNDVYVVPAAGGEAINISNLPGEDHGISWSPDSRSLIFTNESESDLRLYVAAPDGSDTRPLLDVEGNGCGEWAPPPSAKQ